MDVLVNSNIILDILTTDPQWYTWSSKTLALHANSSTLVINPIIYAEISIRFKEPPELEEAISPSMFRRDELPWEAAFLAGKTFLAYRHSGGSKSTTLPDFFIGAHAVVKGMPLMTRDVRRYQTYFPSLPLIRPN